MKEFFQKYLSKIKPEALAQRPLWQQCLTVFTSGAVCSFAQAPYSLWPLFYLGFIVFYLHLKSASKSKTAFLLGWFFGLGYFLFGLNWVGNALLIEGNEFWWVWPLAVIALPSLLAIFTGFAAFIALILNKKHGLTLFITLCITLTFAEYARGHLFTGFPWNLYGYIWGETLTIAQISSFVGPYGLTFLTLFWAIIPIIFIDKTTNYKRSLIAPALTVIAVIFYGAAHLQKPIAYHKDIQVQIVQPNIAQKDKWNNAKLPINLNKHIYLSKRQEDAPPIQTIIVWPETSLGPIFLDSLAAMELINGVLKEHPKNSILLAGALSYKALKDYKIENFNNLTAMKFNAQPKNIYTKTHLVPFGEYVPFKEIIPIKAVSGFSGFTKGQGAQVFSSKGVPPFTPMICYEVIFPGEIINKQNRPEWLLNVTNDAWYGTSAGPYQHFAQSRFRAIEQGLPLVRSANTGISGLIDPMGRVIASHDLMTHGLIISRLPKALPKTFYAKYGDTPLFAFMLLLLAISLYRKQSQV